MRKQQPSSERLSLYVAAVLLLPALVLWRRANALYAPPWYADAWFYLGYFRNLVEFKRHFLGFYYGSRLSWILPGYLIHSVLSPVWANSVLHLIVQSTCTLSLFWTLRLIVGNRAAFLGTLMFSVNPWLWAATGWDYVDGAGIAYCLLAMALLTQFAKRPIKAGFVAAGSAIAAMAYTHLFLATLAPLVILYYFGLVWIHHPADFRRSAVTFCGWAALGFGIVTVILCAVNYRLDGNFWFYAPSIMRAESMAKDFQFERGIFVNHELAPWLWPGIAGCIAAFALLLSSLRAKARFLKQPELLFCGQLLLAAAYMGFLQSRGSTVLGHHPYASYLLPFAFLVMGVSFWPASESMNRSTYMLICGVVFVAMAALWASKSGHPIPLPPSVLWTTLLVAAGTLGVGYRLRRRTAGTLLAACGFIAFTAFTLSSTPQTSYFAGLSLHGNREQYQRIMRARNRIEAVRQGGFPLFWFNRRDHDFHEYFALNATYLAEFSRISEDFPEGCTAGVDPRSLIVVLSENQRAGELARNALDNCWQRFGIRPVMDSMERLSAPGGPYVMAFLRVEAAPLRTSGQQALVTVLLDRLQLGDAKSVFERWPEGLAVTTTGDFGAFAARVSLGAEGLKQAKLSVHVRARVLEGKVGFGILDRDGRKCLVEVPMWPLRSFIEVVLPLPSPPIIGDLVVMNRTNNKKPSTVLIDRIEIQQGQ